MMFDYKKFKTELKNGTKTSFIESDLSDIYSFALYSDENCETIQTVANSLSYLENRRQHYGESSYMLCKFSPDEWDFDILRDNESLKYCTKLLGLEDLVEKNEHEFNTHQSKIYSICIEILFELKQEEFFSKYCKRNLFIVFAASEFEFEKTELQDQIKKLNSIKYFEEYLGWMKTWG